jgi:putative tricarboxylic transport membrane protein
VIESLGKGVYTVVQHWNFVWIFLGIPIGIFIGAIPGLTVTMTLALMIPVTFLMHPVPAVLFLLGIYIAGIYGGSISAILINAPGTPASACTVLDAQPLVQQGRSMEALKVALYASVTGGMMSAITLIVITEPLANIAIKMGPSEMFMLLIFCLTIIGSVSGGSLLKGLISAALGLIFCIVGMDAIYGTMRFTFGSINLSSGISFLPLLIGLLALTEIFIQAEDIVVKKDKVSLGEGIEGNAKIKFSQVIHLFPSFFAGGIAGIIMGILPGIGAALGSFLGYDLGKKISKHPESFGKGSLEGVGASEAGNNGVCGSTFVPLLTLGIPGDSPTAVILGAFMVHGLRPGPLFIMENPSLVQSIYIGLIIANIALLFIGVGGLRVFSLVTRVKQSILFPIVLFLCVIGSYAINGNPFDIWILLLFGVIGYIFRKGGIPAIPFIIGFLVGPNIEFSLQQAIISSGGVLSSFIKRPAAIILLILTLLSVIIPMLLKKKG